MEVYIYVYIYIYMYIYTYINIYICMSRAPTATGDLAARAAAASPVVEAFVSTALDDETRGYLRLLGGYLVGAAGEPRREIYIYIYIGLARMVEKECPPRRGICRRVRVN